MSAIAAAVVAIAVWASPAAAQKFSAKDFQATGTFELAVEKSPYLKPGSSRIQARTGFVTLAHGLQPGNVDGLEVVFLTKPVTETTLPDTSRLSEYATLVLFLGKDGKIAQVNMSFVVPGTTVARTIAWKPEELAKYFAGASYSGRRLVLKGKGSHVESSGAEAFKLSWDVDVNLPVVREIQR